MLTIPSYCCVEQQRPREHSHRAARTRVVYGLREALATGMIRNRQAFVAVMAVAATASLVLLGTWCQRRAEPPVVVHNERLLDLPEQLRADVTHLASTIGERNHEHPGESYPFPFSLAHPDRGNFIAFVSNSGSRDLLDQVTKSFGSTPIGRARRDLAQPHPRHATLPRRLRGHFRALLHHFPYFGLRGAADREALDTSYETTKALYQREFGEPLLEIIEVSA